MKRGYEGPPMRKANLLLAVEISRVTGLPLVAFDSYAAGEDSDPTTVHVAASLQRGRYLDAQGTRGYSDVVSGLFGATFRTRPVTEDDVRAMVPSAAGEAPDPDTVSSRAEDVVAEAGIPTVREEAGLAAASP